jgi:hypothetical protein
MSNRQFLKHVISKTEPVGLNLGDEWFNPDTNALYKLTVVNGSSVEFILISPIETSNLSNNSQPTVWAKTFAFMGA